MVNTIWFRVYNLISGWFNKISKIFLYMYVARSCLGRKMFFFRVFFGRKIWKEFHPGPNLYFCHVCFTSAILYTQCIQSCIMLCTQYIHWENYVSISFHIEWDMIVVTVFQFRFSEPNGIPFGSKSKGKLSPRLYPIQCKRKWKHSFFQCTELYIAVYWKVLCVYRAVYYCIAEIFMPKYSRKYTKYTECI